MQDSPHHDYSLNEQDITIWEALVISFFSWACPEHNRDTICNTNRPKSDALRTMSFFAGFVQSTSQAEHQFSRPTSFFPVSFNWSGTYKWQCNQHILITRPPLRLSTNSMHRISGLSGFLPIFFREASMLSQQVVSRWSRTKNWWWSRVQSHYELMPQPFWLIESPNFRTREDCDRLVI